MSVSAFLICLGTAMVLGVFTSLVFSAKSRHTGSWAQSLALLPPIVTLVIMMVNGNIGAGLAVAGTFALVRFRSVPGTAREITGLFASVAVGLACGMGYVGCALLFFLVMAAFVALLSMLRFGEAGCGEKQLKITIPENLDYEGLFDDLFLEYAKSWELVRVRTTNMGTLFELSYNISLKTPGSSKEFIDAIRCRNGNLNIIFGREADRDMM
ncbi:MAG: DUF4956 domain-containing protein [Oscillospiraceae bacterium]|nr:DUF4956 domain-containing protein [Oscillospiraceae bacterium]